MPQRRQASSAELRTPPVAVGKTQAAGNTKSSKSTPPLPDVLTGSSADMPSRYDFNSVEKCIYSWWEEAGFFKPRDEAGAKPFVICMPPPNVTGSLHMGHALGTALQDIMTRFHRMRGKSVLFLPGTDHAGIATQLQVEKALAKDGVKRLEIGRDAFLDAVWSWKREKGDYICEQMRRLGASCDWSRHRFTLESDISAAVREAFVRLYDDGLIYRGEYLVNWSPTLRTAVSDLEVDFAEEQGKLFYFKYCLAGSDSKEEFIPVATTRPETILGDTAVCVHPDDPRYQKYIGKNVRVPILGREIPVIADDYVDREFGTGALKITPGHDMNDYDIGKRHNLPLINIMNKDASINANGGPLFEGLDRFEVREKLWGKMTAAGLVLKVEDYATRVPRSQRGGEIIEPLVSTQWFAKMRPLAEPALAAVKKGDIKILPSRFEKVYYGWLEDIHDWCISRQLWWGHRIPVWYVSEHPGECIVARDEHEARAKANAKYGAETVHLEQDSDVLDTWFSSGLWPFATMGWPNTASTDLSKYYPGSVMETGYDILFFWVARMIMLGISLAGRIPFDTVYLHGLVRDGAGRKMSKTVGNVIDPIDTINEFGTDALRYSLVTGTTPGQDVPLSMERIELNRNFANKLWNACRYTLGNLADAKEDERRRLAVVAVSDFGSAESIKRLSLAERYIISRLHMLIECVTEGLENLEFGEVGRRIHDFLWDEFADWYVEASKTRLYGKDANAAEMSRTTLVYVLDSCLRLLHPFMPFVTEALWHRFPRDGSSESALITAAWPHGGHVDHDAICRFDRLQMLIRAVRNARAEYKLDASKRIPLVIHADKQTLQDAQEETAVLALLAKIDADRIEFRTHHKLAIEQTSQSSCPEATDSIDKSVIRLIVAEELDAYLPLKGVLDVEKERGRLEKQLEKVQKDLDGLLKRLNADGFTKKAPAHVVSATRESANGLTEKVGSLMKRIAEVDALTDTN